MPEMNRRDWLKLTAGSSATFSQVARQDDVAALAASKEGDKLILEAAAPRSLLALLATLEPIDEDFAPIDDHAPKAVEP